MPQLRYDGPASIFQDPTSNTMWNVGETQSVDDATAGRLLALYTGKQMDHFTDVGLKSETPADTSSVPESGSEPAAQSVPISSPGEADSDTDGRAANA